MKAEGYMPVFPLATQPSQIGDGLYDMQIAPAAISLSPVIPAANALYQSSNWACKLPRLQAGGLVLSIYNQATQVPACEVATELTRHKRVK